MQLTEVLPSNCLNWPSSNSILTIRSWCQQLEEVLLAKAGKGKRIDMVCDIILCVLLQEGMTSLEGRLLESYQPMMSSRRLSSKASLSQHMI